MYQPCGRQLKLQPGNVPADKASNWHRNGYSATTGTATGRQPAAGVSPRQKAGFTGAPSALKRASDASSCKAAAPSFAEKYASEQAPPPLATHFSRRATQAADKQNKQ
jgi:hypothetical protein